jgi:hypothetical protein
MLSRDFLLIAEYALVRTACVGDKERDDHAHGARIVNWKLKISGQYDQTSCDVAYT